MLRFARYRPSSLFALLAVFALVLAAAPLQGVRAQDEVTISYFTFSAAPDHLGDLDQMIALFEAANPGIKVEVETAAYADYFTELQTRIAGGEAPDTFELNYENFVTYASKGTLLDLTTSIGTDTAARYYPKAFEAFQLDGKQYGLPTSFSNVVLFYNKDLFDAAGVAYPTADWTWTEELDAATKLTNADDDIWGMYSPISFHEFYKTAAQNGCSFFGEDGSVTINEPACVEALEFMVSAQEQGVQPSDADLAGVPNEDLFKQGKIAMLTSGIWMFSGFADLPFNWDIALEPGNTQDGHHFFANAAVVSADTDEAEAAAKWAAFFTSDPEAAKVRVAASWELPALQDQTLFDSYLSQTPPESREVVFEALDSLVTPPVIEKQQQMQDAVTAVLDQVKAGEMTPQEALDQAKSDIEALLAT
ncbi:MAG: sugar ABC transporter substrate-binding protein [Thermomicrobiales bacterium]|nr:sugar ABC transporter substrate-binding protein [Thermomicrobiales bacterium]